MSVALYIGVDLLPIHHRYCTLGTCKICQTNGLNNSAQNERLDYAKDKTKWLQQKELGVSRFRARRSIGSLIQTLLGTAKVNGLKPANLLKNTLENPPV